MAIQTGMSYGLIHKFSERKTPSLVTFSDPVKITLNELSDQILFFHRRSRNIPIPFTRQKLDIWAAFQF